MYWFFPFMTSNTFASIILIKGYFAYANMLLE